MTVDAVYLLFSFGWLIHQYWRHQDIMYDFDRKLKEVEVVVIKFFSEYSLILMYTEQQLLICWQIGSSTSTCTRRRGYYPHLGLVSLMLAMSWRSARSRCIVGLFEPPVAPT